MKLIVVAITAILLSLGSYQSQASNIQRFIVSLCDYAKNNNRSSMRKKLKQSKLKLRRVYKDISCSSADGFNGGSLLRISTYFGSFEAAKYISTQIGKKGILNTESDGQNILAWTEHLKTSGAAKAQNLQNFIDLYKSKS